MRFYMTIVFAVSFLLLLGTLIKIKGLKYWTSYFGINLIAGIFLLYALQYIAGYTHFNIPINTMTILTIGVLGLPGLLLLAAIKLTLL